MRLYALLGAIIAFLALGAGLLWYRGEAASARAERDQAKAALTITVTANAAWVKANAEMRDQAKRTDQLLSDLAGDVDKIQQTTTATNDAIGGLKESNADIRAYLDGAVPSALQLQLNK